MFDPMQRARDWATRATERAADERARTRRLLGKRRRGDEFSTPGLPEEWTTVETLESLPDPSDDDIGRLVHIRTDAGVDVFNVGVQQADDTVTWAPLNITLDSGAETWSFLRAMATPSLPWDAAIAPNGDIWVTESNSNRMQRFSASGALLQTVGAFGGGNGQFKTPAGIAIAPDGSIYVGDMFNHRVQKFTSAGAYSAQVGSQGAGNGQFQSPIGIAVDPSGNVYVADSNNNRIQKFTSGLVYTTQWGTAGNGQGQFNRPNAIEADRFGNVYVADTFNDRVQKFDQSGAFLAAWGATGNGNGQFNFPLGIAVDQAGNVFVSDTDNSRIQKFDEAGAFLTRFGTYGGGDGQVRSPYGLVLDAAGVLYVVDFASSRVTIWSILSDTTLSSYPELDDFNGGNSSSGTIGELGWKLQGAGNVTPQNSTAAHAGIIRISSGNASGNNGRISFGPFVVDTLAQTDFVFRPNDSTNVFYRVGLIDDANAPGDGCYLEWDTLFGDSNWKLVRNVGGVTTRTDSGLLMTAGAWYRLRVRWLASGQVEAAVRRMDTGVELGVTMLGLSTTAQLNLWFMVHTRQNASKTMDVDAARHQTQGISRV